LRGVLTALESARTDRVIVATVDMPGITRMHLLELAEQLDVQSQRVGVLLSRRDGDETFVEPFPSAYRTAAAEAVAATLAEDRGAVRALARREGFVTLPAPVDWSVVTWTNLNSTADVTAFVAGLGEPTMRGEAHS
jgi:molybdopterin-guanine dinucleotide biosynthesis protein A